MDIRDKVALNILDDLFNVFSVKEHYINTNNSGVLNEDNLKYEKRKLLKDSITYLSEELVDSIQDYPENDLSKVELTTDFLVIKRRDFNHIKETIERLIDKDE